MFVGCKLIIVYLNVFIYRHCKLLIDYFPLIFYQSLLDHAHSFSILLLKVVRAQANHCWEQQAIKKINNRLKGLRSEAENLLSEM